MKIYTSKNILDLKNVPILDNYQIYIYVMLNSQGKIKIGQTTNIVQRLQSLSGSNGGGEKIIRLYCSPPTFVKSMEKAIHNHFNKYRIQGTEWFEGLDFDEVIEHVDSLFYTKSYNTCNELRKGIAEKEREINKQKELEEQNKLNNDNNISEEKQKSKRGRKKNIG